MKFLTGDNWALTGDSEADVKESSQVNKYQKKLWQLCVHFRRQNLEPISTALHKLTA